MEKITIEDLGNIPYAEAWAYQTEIHQQLVQNKLSNRQRIADGENAHNQQHRFLLCEHPPVYTLGKSGSIDHLLLTEQELSEKGFTFFKINRGGDITYHGPGQWVGYPILDMECLYTDVHRYVRDVEEVIIRTIGEYGLKGERIHGYTGVWLPGNPARKICAIGIHFSRWVSMHGFAFNINTDLSHFDYIVPCGIEDDDKTVTSLQKELGRVIDMQEVKEHIIRHFADVFGVELEKTAVC